MFRRAISSTPEYLGILLITKYSGYPNNLESYTSTAIDKTSNYNHVKWF